MSSMSAAIFFLVAFAGLFSTIQAGNIATPPFYAQKLRTYQLPNGIRALSIEHKSASRSAFATAVRAGSLSDPLEVQGLAHLLEHVLFLGTRSHPDPHEFANFLGERGGQSDAVTEADSTTFYGSVDTDSLQEALQRFSEFFSEPLLSYSEQGREVSVVDSECAMSMANDDLRAETLLASLFPFPLNAFHRGNFLSLRTIPKRLGIKVFDRLRAFHRKFYCGENLSVVTLSPRSLAEQEALVRSVFARISSNNEGNCRSWKGTLAELSAPDFHLLAQSEFLQSFFPICETLEDSGDSERRLGASSERSNGGIAERRDIYRTVTALSDEPKMYTEEVKSYWDISPATSFFGVGRWPLVARMGSQTVSFVKVSWRLPSSLTLYREQPLRYILYMLNHGGAFGLGRKLMRRQWVASWSADFDDQPLSSSLTMSFRPTSEGLKKLDLILETISAFVNDLRTAGVDEMVLESIVSAKEKVFENAEGLSDLEARVSGAAYSLLLIDDPHDLLRMANLITKPSASLIQKYLNLLTLDRATVLISSTDWAPPTSITERELLTRSCVRLVTDDGLPLIYRSHPVYSIPHTLELMTKALRDKLVTASQGDIAEHLKGLTRLPLPPPIRKLPDRLRAVQKSPRASRPETLMKRPSFTIWWGGAGLFRVKMAKISIMLRHHHTTMNAECISARDFLLPLASDLLSVPLSEYEEAGYTVTAESESDGYHLTVHGYRHQSVFREILVVAARAIRRVTLEGTSETRFQREKHRTLISLKTDMDLPPMRTAIESLALLICPDYIPIETKSTVLRTHPAFESASAFAEFTRKHLAAAHMTSLSTGLTRRETVHLSLAFLKSLGFQHLSRSMALDPKALDLRKPVQLYLENALGGDLNNAAVLSFRGKAPVTIEEFVRLSILAHFLHTKIHNTIRTDKQLGYIAGATIGHYPYNAWLQIFVGGSNVTALEAASQLRTSLAQFREEVANLSPADIQDWRDAVKPFFSPAVHSAEEEHDRMWNALEADAPCFERRELMTQYLTNSTMWSSGNSLLRTLDGLLGTDSRIEVLVERGRSRDWQPIYDKLIYLRGDSDKASRIPVVEWAQSTVESFKKRQMHVPSVDICALTEAG